MSAQIVTGAEMVASEHVEMPEGLAAASLAQCQNPTCLHEFTVVTHQHILSSLRTWNRANLTDGVARFR
jgi:hypothetical protein